MPSTTVIITFQAHREHAQEFGALMRQTRQDLPGVPGCRSVRLFAATDGHTFTLLEEWESEQAHRAHLKRVVASGDWDRIAAQLACDPMSRYYAEP